MLFFILGRAVHRLRPLLPDWNMPDTCSTAGTPHWKQPHIFRRNFPTLIHHCSLRTSSRGDRDLLKPYCCDASRFSSHSQSTSLTYSQMAGHNRFSSLPAEIRIMIYKEILVQVNPIRFHIMAKRGHGTPGVGDAGALSYHDRSSQRGSSSRDHPPFPFAPSRNVQQCTVVGHRVVLSKLRAQRIPSSSMCHGAQVPKDHSWKAGLLRYAQLVGSLLKDMRDSMPRLIMSMVMLNDHGGLDVIKWKHRLEVIRLQGWAVELINGADQRSFDYFDAEGVRIYWAPMLLSRSEEYLSHMQQVGQDVRTQNGGL
ncbi:hypothetical protein M8818_000626 [Zalaria obscura]|uniref:Uncharacterized protein n=1 Tax=Zalaria obscura TaxID=2024903 RepID=A0ACC3SMF4_9PEZI